MGGEQVGDPGQHIEPCRRCGGFAEQGLAKFAEEQGGCDFASLVGELPFPCARRIGSTDGSFHGAPQDGRINALACFETRQ